MVYMMSHIWVTEDDGWHTLLELLSAHDKTTRMILSFMSAQSDLSLCCVHEAIMSSFTSPRKAE